MTKKNDSLERSKWIFLGFIFALIISTGILLTKAFNSEPPNYPTNPRGVVNDFYTWYIECLNSGSNCDLSQSNLLSRSFTSNIEERKVTIVCSKDPVEEFEIDEVTIDHDSAIAHVHAMSSTSTVSHIKVRLTKVRGIWKMNDLTCGHD